MSQGPSLERQKRTQADRRDESERRLLDAMIEIVEEEGVGATTFENIARRAGYSRGLAFLKFGSKEGLIRALIRRLQQSRIDALQALDIGHMTGLDALNTYIRLHFDELTATHDTRAYFTLAAGAVADLSTIRNAFSESHAQSRIFLEQLILRGQIEGCIRADVDPTGAALAIGSLLLGASMQHITDPDTNLEQLKMSALALTATGLAVVKPATTAAVG
ncbi:MAG: TetR/AcrR family transcriptional regulator [Rhizomicrobium sp.]